MCEKPVYFAESNTRGTLPCGRQPYTQEVADIYVCFMQYFLEVKAITVALNVKINSIIGTLWNDVKL